MTVMADEKGNVAVPTDAPGHRFDVEFARGGKIVLTPEAGVAQQNDGVTLIRKNGKLFGVLGRPIDEEALAAALQEVP